MTCVLENQAWFVSLARLRPVKAPILNILMIVSVLGWSCSGDDPADAVAQPTLAGSWKFTSFIVSGCDDPADDREDRCTGSAGECGVLTMKDSSWTWVQNLADGSQFKETGTYTLSTNYIILTGDTAPGLGKYSITGSTVSYTTTSLTFVNSSETSGCAFTVTFARHLQSGVPLG